MIWWTSKHASATTYFVRIQILNMQITSRLIKLVFMHVSCYTISSKNNNTSYTFVSDTQFIVTHTHNLSKRPSKSNANSRGCVPLKHCIQVTWIFPCHSPPIISRLVAPTALFFSSNAPCSNTAKWKSTSHSRQIHNMKNTINLVLH